jgi:hypothetical protein
MSLSPPLGPRAPSSSDPSALFSFSALLAGHAWDWTAALAALQRFVLAHLGDAEAVVVLDETAELKKGDRTVGVGLAACGDHRAGGLSSTAEDL